MPLFAQQMPSSWTPFARISSLALTLIAAPMCAKKPAGRPPRSSDPETLYILARDTAQLVYTGPQPRIAFVTRDHPALHDPDPALIGAAGLVQRRALRARRARR